jgi:hypothetical protein
MLSSSDHLNRRAAIIVKEDNIRIFKFNLVSGEKIFRPDLLK